jgi:hypothetical protein
MNAVNDLGIVSAFHLLALAIGLPSVFERGRALTRIGCRRVSKASAADNLWEIAALLWIVTGLCFAGGLEKSAQFISPTLSGQSWVYSCRSLFELCVLPSSDGASSCRGQTPTLLGFGHCA